MISLFKKYRERTLQYGSYDCNLMVLEHLGINTAELPTYRTIQEGIALIKPTFGVDSITDVLQLHNYEQIDSLLCYDGDILVDGIHCYIYFDGLLFGINKDTKTFQFNKITLTELMKFEAYKYNKNKGE